MKTNRFDSKHRILKTGESQRRDGSYQYRYKYQNKWVYVYSPRLVRSDPPDARNSKCLRELEDDIQKNLLNGINPIAAHAKRCLDDFVRDFWASKSYLAQSTLNTYHNIYEKHIRPVLGKKEIDTIVHSTVVSFYSDLLTKVKSSSMLNSFDTVLNGIFEAAVNDGVLQFNPVNGVGKKVFRNKGEKATVEALSIDQQRNLVEILLRDSAFAYYRYFFLFLLGTGCRISEGNGITWNDIDFKNNLISFNHQTYRNQLSEW